VRARRARPDGAPPWDLGRVGRRLRGDARGSVRRHQRPPGRQVRARAPRRRGGPPARGKPSRQTLPRCSSASSAALRARVSPWSLCARATIAARRGRRPDGGGSDHALGLKVCRLCADRFTGHRAADDALGL
jgi:hypothetical protein